MTATIVTRTLASTPQCVATDTWRTIVELIAPDPSSAARSELKAVAGIACSAIADEALRDDALTVFGSGPRVRFYCLYGDDALEGNGVNDSPLAFVATGGDWQMSIPCQNDDLTWMQRTLAKVSQRVTARTIGTDVDDGRSAKETVAAFVVDLSAYNRS